jgi:23S rRNA G2445 N2-methylase RlmL
MLGNILEPACGDGAIVKVLKDNGYTEITAYDKETNFLKETKKYDTVITNPPFSLAYEFIQKAKEVSENKIYMLLPLNYLHGKKRYDNIYQDKDFGLRSVYVFTRYPLLGELLRKDGKHNTGMVVYAWYVFQKGYNGNPEIDWLDNDSYILRKGE